MSWNVALLIAVLSQHPESISTARWRGFGHAIAHSGFGMQWTQPGLLHAPARWTHRAGGGDCYRYSDFGWSDLSYPYYGDYWNSSRHADDGSPNQPITIVLLPVPRAPESVSPALPLRPQACTSTRGRIPAVMARPLLRSFPKMGQFNVQRQSGSRTTAYALSHRRVSAGT